MRHRVTPGNYAGTAKYPINYRRRPCDKRDIAPSFSRAANELKGRRRRNRKGAPREFPAQMVCRFIGNRTRHPAYGC